MLNWVVEIYQEQLANSEVRRRENEPAFDLEMLEKVAQFASELDRMIGIYPESGNFQESLSIKFEYLLVGNNLRKCKFENSRIETD